LSDIGRKHPLFRGRIVPNHKIVVLDIINDELHDFCKVVDFVDPGLV